MEAIYGSDGEVRRRQEGEKTQKIQENAQQNARIKKGMQILPERDAALCSAAPATRCLQTPGCPAIAAR